MLRNVDFIKNFNGKLCNDIFSTCRIKDEKYFIGEVHNISLNKQPLGTAKIIAIKEFQLKSIRDDFSLLEAGVSAARLAGLINVWNEDINTRIDGDTNLVSVLYQWQKRGYQNTIGLLQDHFENVRQNYLQSDSL